MSNTVLEMIFHKQQEMLNLSIKAQKLHICYLGPKIWDLLPKKNIKYLENINIFKSNVKLW